MLPLDQVLLPASTNSMSEYGIPSEIPPYEVIYSGIPADNYWSDVNAQNNLVVVGQEPVLPPRPVDTSFDSAVRTNNQLETASGNITLRNQ